MQNTVFFPQALLDVLSAVGKVDLEGEDLVLKDGNYRYRASEAVRVTAEVTTGEDPHNLLGKVALTEYLTSELGAELMGNSLLFDDNAYDVIPGMLGSPSTEIDPGAIQHEQDTLANLQNIDDL